MLNMGLVSAPRIKNNGDIIGTSAWAAWKPVMSSIDLVSRSLVYVNRSAYDVYN